MNSFPERLTAYGSTTLEGLLASQIQTIGATIEDAIQAASHTTLLLIGGYGRGEGGVEVDPLLNQEQPHNNLDLLLITDHPRHIPSLHRKLLQPLQALNQSMPISIDLSIVSHDQIRRSPPLVLWYDIKHGHKTIFGNPTLMDTLRPHDSVQHIAPWDMRNLLTNRATLLLINDHLCQLQPTQDHRTLIRHAIKAIIGVGDALLFFLGDYHWSYLEKMQRMARRDDVDPSFRQLYQQAASFRLRPDYSAFQSLDLHHWLARIRTSLEPIHRQCESFRLGVHFDDWTRYLPHALLAELSRKPAHWRSWARKSRHLANHIAPLFSTPFLLPSPSLITSLGALITSNANLLSLLFPFLAYSPQPPSYARDLFSLLAIPDMPDDRDFRRLYLHAWARYCDTNFLPILHQIEAPLTQGVHS